MDISKYKKPIHCTCPNCKADISFSGYEIVMKRNSLREEVGKLKGQIHNYKLKYGNFNAKEDAYYRKLVKEHTDKENQLRIANEQVSLASDIANREVFEVFKSLVKSELGEEKFKKLIIEAEESVSYNIKELPKQKFTNYQDIG